MDYAVEVKLVFEKLTEIKQTSTSYQLLKELVIADKIMSSVPEKSSAFLV